MKRVANFFRIIIVSPETAFIAVLYLCVYFYPVFFVELAHRINAVEAVIKYLAFVPVALGGVIVRQKDELLFPKHKMNDILQKWPNYDFLLLDTYRVCLLFEAISIIATIGIWITGADLQNYLVFSVFMCGIVVAIISYVSFLNAIIRIKRILFTAN